MTPGNSGMMPLMAVGFFDMFFDSDYRQRGDINDAQRAAADARFYGNLALETTDALRAQIMAQRDQIRDLGVLTSVVVKMLGEAGLLDEKILRYRVEAELDARIEAARPAVQPTTCLRCQQQVPAALTQMTEDGAVCDRCMAGAR